MDEKTQARIKKLQALAERGVGGEKETAARKLQELLEKNGISSVEELAQDEYIFTLFSYNGVLGRKLLSQCIYKVMGYDSDRTQYKPPHTRQKIGVYCTKAQKLEIELEFEFYERLFEEQQELFLSAFIQKQRIFPPDAPVNDAEPTERDIMVKDKDGVVKYWVRPHEVTCNYTEYEHDVEYDRYYRLRESREYKKHGKAVRERITKKEYLAIKKITQEYIARCNKSSAEE